MRKILNTLQNRLRLIILGSLLIFVVLFQLEIVSPCLSHYYFLSQSLTQGKLDITKQIIFHFNPSPEEVVFWDLAIFNRQYFVYLGVFPAIIGLPFLILGPAGNRAGLFCFSFALVTITLAKIVKHFLKDSGLLTALLLIIASPAFTNLIFPGPWYQASLMSFSLGLLFLWLYKIKKKNWAIILIAPMFLTIPVTIFYALIPLADLFIQPQQRKQKLFFIILTLSTALFVHGAYNYLRFGHPLEAGYKYAIVPPEDFLQHRQSENRLTVILSNAVYYLVNPPRIHLNQALRVTFPFFELSRYGIGLLFTMPWFLPYLFYNQQKRHDWPYLIPLLMIMLAVFYFSGGGTNQIGPRHANDFLPLLIFIYLKWLSKNKKHRPIFRKLLNISLFLNIYFYLLFITGHLRRF